MTYTDYQSTCRRLKAEQSSLDKKFIAEYSHRDMFGKVVRVRYRFKGKIRFHTAYFEGLEPFFHDMIPVLKYVKEDGTPCDKRVDNIYSLKQIEEIKLAKLK